jgi:hypothetical protein
MKLNLADLKKRWRARSVLAITVESGRVNVALVRRDNGETRVIESFTLPFGADAVVADAETIGKELAKQLEAAGIRERRCVLCIPPSWALTAPTDVPAINAEDLRGYFELRAEREFPMSLSDLRLAHCTYTLPDGKESATLAAIPAARIRAVEQMVASAECRVVSLSLGLDRCRPGAEQPPALHFLANGNHVDLVIGAGGGIVALRSLPSVVGGNVAAFDATSFSREVRITLGRLPEGLREQLRQADFGGTRSSAETLCRATHDQLLRIGIESRVGGEASRLGDRHGEHSGVAVESAEHHLQGQPVAFEFVPPETPRWQTLLQRFDSRRRRWIVGGAILFLVLPLLVFIVRARIESGLAAEWKAMQKNVAELELFQQKIRRFRPWFESTPQSVQILEAVTSAFPEQGDVWAKSVQINEGAKVTCSGFARTQPALMGFLDRLRSRPDVAMLQVQQVRGENPVQFSVTYKWEPQNAK